jgi:hypothetical protein
MDYNGYQGESVIDPDKPWENFTSADYKKVFELIHCLFMPFMHRCVCVRVLCVCAREWHMHCIARSAHLYSKYPSHVYIHTHTHIFALIHPRGWHIAFVIDEAQWLSYFDWRLLWALVNNFKEFGMMTAWIGCRDLRCKVYQPSKFHRSPPEFVQVLEKAQIIHCGPLDSAATNLLMKSELGTRRMDPDLVKVAHTLSGGMPLYTLRLSQSLQDMGILVSSPTYAFLQDKWCTTLDWQIVLPVPSYVVRIVQSHIDVLTEPEFYILKVATVLSIGYVRARVCVCVCVYL